MAAQMAPAGLAASAPEPLSIVSGAASYRWSNREGPLPEIPHARPLSALWDQSPQTLPQGRPHLQGQKGHLGATDRLDSSPSALLLPRWPEGLHVGAGSFLQLSLPPTGSLFSDIRENSACQEMVPIKGSLKLAW